MALNDLSKMKIVSGLIVVFIVTPIWYYLLFKILSVVGATDLMWFLYWVYVPFSLFAAFVAKIAESD